MGSRPTLHRLGAGARLELAAGGSWTASHASELEPLIDSHTRLASGASGMSIDMRGVNEFDTFGAWLLERLVRAWGGLDRQARITGLADHFQGLLDEVRQANRDEITRLPKPNAVLLTLHNLGKSVEDTARGFVPFLNIFGAVGTALATSFVRPKSFRLTSAVHHLDRVGWQAIPIILLISFLIGCIIAQQGFFHFRQFGADIYVVDMVGILVLREIGVLIVAIMVAGRSGSSYTAELGSMKMREEVDALQTMGLDPIAVLVLPRVLALIIALPVLAFLGSMAALYGAGLVAWFYGGMSPATFIERLKEAITVTHFAVGLIKAPFMALVIGIVACSEGFRVQGSAESLGIQTTNSVVKSIFAVIVFDGIFAIFFASIGM